MLRKPVEPTTFPPARQAPNAADDEATADDGSHGEAAQGAPASLQPIPGELTPAATAPIAGVLDEMDVSYETETEGPGRTSKRHVHVWDLIGTCWRCGFEYGETCDRCRCGAIRCIRCDDISDASQVAHAAPVAGAREAQGEAAPARTASQVAADKSEVEERQLESLNQACAADPEVRADVEEAMARETRDLTSIDLACYDDHTIRLDMEYELGLHEKGYDLAKALAHAHLHGGVT